MAEIIVFIKRPKPSGPSACIDTDRISDVRPFTITKEQSNMQRALSSWSKFNRPLTTGVMKNVNR